MFVQIKKARMKLFNCKNSAQVRLGLAENPLTTFTVRERLLASLADESDWMIRESVAGNPSTPVNILEILATDKEGSVRSNVASNESTSASVLKFLAADKDEYVRGMVAGNKFTPADTLAILIKDKCGLASEHASQNPSISQEELETIALDNEPFTQFHITKNPTISHALRMQLLVALVTKKKVPWMIKQFIASDVNTPPSILEILSKDCGDEFVVRKVAENPSTPASVLATLLGEC